MDKIEPTTDSTDSPIKAGRNFIRKFALILMDDDNGIKKEAYELLSVILVDSDNADILDCVDIAKDRVYLGETFVQEELDKLKDEEIEDEPNV